MGDAPVMECTTDMVSRAAAETQIHLPCLLIALVVMSVGTLYPPLLADAADALTICRRVSRFGP